MKRIIAALAILIIVFGSATSVYLKIISSVDRLTCISCEIRDSVTQKKKTDFWQTERLVSEWDKVEAFMGAFLNHSELDEIEIGIKNISDYHGQGLADEYLEELNNVINRLEHLKESEKPVLRNIF